MTIQLGTSHILPSSDPVKQPLFQVRQCTDYQMLRCNMKVWYKEIAQIETVYLRMIRAHQTNTMILTEYENIKSSKHIIESLELEAETAMNFPYAAEHKEFYICLAKKRIQAVAMISKESKQEEINQSISDFLEIELLATHPTNIRASGIKHQNTSQIVKGAGSFLLKHLEQLAYQKELGIYAAPRDSALPFYLQQNYQTSDNREYIIKTKEQIITELAKKTIQNFKAA